MMPTDLRGWSSRSLDVVVETNRVDIFKSSIWRMKATVEDFYDMTDVDSSDDPLRWYVDIFYLFSDRKCTKKIDVYGSDAISSGFTYEFFSFFGDRPKYALTPPEGDYFWRGLPDENNDYWLGLDRDQGPIFPKCVRIKQLDREGGSPMKSVQIEASYGGNWQSVYAINNLCSDCSIPLPYQSIATYHYGDPHDSFLETDLGIFVFAIGIFSILSLILYCGHRLGIPCLCSDGGGCNVPDISGC